MENIYNETIKKVEDGAKFTISFEKQSLKVNGKYIIKNGQYEGEILSPIDTTTALSQIEDLYNRYRHSIPSERSDNKRKTYFQALSEKDMSDDDMLYGEPREIAQVKLELYVLCLILNGSLDWDKFAKDKWFWKSEKHPTLIILQEWIKSPYPILYGKRYRERYGNLCWVSGTDYYKDKECTQFECRDPWHRHFTNKIIIYNGCRHQLIMTN